MTPPSSVPRSGSALALLAAMVALAFTVSRRRYNPRVGEGRMPSATEQIVARLTSRGVAFTIHEHVVARTVADALERLPFSPDSYLKTVAFRLKAGGWVLAALRGADRVDYRGLAAALGVGRRDLHQMTPDEVASDLGYPIGGVGPVPTNELTRTVFDALAVEQLDTVYCGAGRPDRTLEVGLAELIAACDGLVGRIAQPPLGSR